MSEVKRSSAPLAIAAATAAVVSIAVARLPESFVAVFERSRPFSSGQSGWALRLLAIAAVAQAAYGGFVLLSSGRVDRMRDGMGRDDTAALAARYAGFMVVLTMVYGIASFVVTRQRGGFWLFVVIAISQIGWYHRRLGELTRWLSLQPDPPAAAADDHP